MAKMNLSGAIKKAAMAAKKYSSKDKGNKLARLQAKESELVYRGNKAVDEGRDKKANRLLRRAAKVENRIIKTVEK
jgi:hypothetical protein